MTKKKLHPLSAVFSKNQLVSGLSVFVGLDVETFTKTAFVWKPERFLEDPYLTFVTKLRENDWTNLVNVKLANKALKAL